MAANPKIAFIGAGSTVFMKNIIGDVLQRPALAGAEIHLMDIDPNRLADSEVVARKIASTLKVGATVKTFTDQTQALDGADFVVVAFQIGGYEPAHRHRLRGAEEVRPAPDHRRHARHRRHHARPPHRPASSGRSARTWTAVCPDAIMLQYVNPMAINTWAIAGQVPAHPPGRPLPLGAGHRRGAGRRPRHPDRRDPLPLRRHQPHGLLPQLRGDHAGRVLPRPLPGPAARLPRRPLPEARHPQPALPQQGALRGADAPRLLRHRELGAFRRIRALVHQARPAGPDREVRHPARRVPAALHRADRQVGEAGAGIPRRRHASRCKASHEYASRSSTRPGPARRRSSTATSRTTA